MEQSNEVAFERTIFIIWAVLVVATALSWLLGNRVMLADPALQAIGIIVIAMIKVWLVISYFMEVRHADWWLRAVCTSWVVITGAAMIGGYLML